MKIIKAEENHEYSRKKVALVTSLFNKKLTKKLEQGALDCLTRYGIKPAFQIYVPGSMEIPLVVRALLEKENCDGVVVLGVVIRGETSHYDLVCHCVERGCSSLQLKFNKPVGFGILTTENREQTRARCEGTRGNKGFEATQALMDMLQILDKIK